MKPYLAIFLVVAACADEGPADEFSPFDDQSRPNPDGKSDEARACGASSCTPRLCGYDCTAGGSQCTQTCAPSDGRAETFVTATFTGAHSSTFDSRSTAFDEVFSLDNVLIYGCDLWDFSNQVEDGLEIELTELIHSSFVVDPNDPTRHDRKFLAYVAPFTGPGSYRAEAMFQASHDAPRFYDKDACTVDIAADATGGITGTFECALGQQAGSGTVGVTGSFGCPINAMDPLFVRRTP